MYYIYGYTDLRVFIALARSTLRDEEPIAQLQYWLNSYTQSKYNIPPKALICSFVQKIQHSGTCLKINTALGFASCCIYLSTRPFVLYFPYKLAAVL